MEAIDGYRIVRVVRSDMRPIEYVRHLLELLPPSLFIVPGIFAGIVLGLVAACETTIMACRFAVRGIRNLDPRRMRRAGMCAATDAAIRPQPVPAAVMRGLRARCYYIGGLLKMHFAPATVLFFDYIRKMPKKPDVVHCNDLETLLVGVLAKRHFGCRVVYDAHEYYPYCDPYGRWLDIKFFAILESWLIRYVDGAVTVNPMLANIMSNAYEFPRFYAVPNAEPVAVTVAEPFRSRMSSLATGRLKCLFQGRYSPRRGTEELILGWQHVDRSKAVLFLRGPHNVWMEEAKALARKLGLLDTSIFFLDAVSEDQLVAAATEADIGIVPYLPEFLIYQYSCPNKLSQYMHAGLMIVTNDLAYVRSVVEEADAGLVYNSNHLETLGAIINQVANDRDLLVRFKQNSIHYAHERFNWQAYCGIFDALYRGQDPAAPR